MLENAREYLEERLNTLNKWIDEITEENELREKEYTEACKLLNFLEGKRIAKRSLILLSTITGLCLCGLGVSICAATSGMLINIFIGSCIISSTYSLLSLHQLVKTNKTLKKTFNQSEYPFKLLILDKPSNSSRFIMRRYIDPISRNEESLESMKEERDAIYSIFTNDDFIKELTNHSDYWFVEESLKSEWDAYLEEISHIKPQEVNLEVSNLEESTLDDIKKYLLTQKKN